MFALPRRRSWVALVAVLLLSGFAAPAFFAFMQPSMADCADPGSGAMLDCSGSSTKAISCGLSGCAGIAAEFPSRALHTDLVIHLVSYPPVPAEVVAGSVWSPEPFPPKPAVSG